MRPQQLDLEDFVRRAAEAERLRNAGMARAAAAQDASVPDWAELAYRAIRSIAQRQPTVHVDDVIQEFSIEPAHPNSWGSVWMRLLKDGVIERTGTVRPSADPKKHKHQYPVYRSAICGVSRQPQ